MLLTSIPIVSAAKKSADYELSYEHKFINVAEGYSCYESFIEDMVYLITEQPTSRSSLPRLSLFCGPLIDQLLIIELESMNQCHTVVLPCRFKVKTLLYL